MSELHCRSLLPKRLHDADPLSIGHLRGHPRSLDQQLRRPLRCRLLRVIDSQHEQFVQRSLHGNRLLLSARVDRRNAVRVPRWHLRCVGSFSDQRMHWPLQWRAMGGGWTNNIVVQRAVHGRLLLPRWVNVPN